MATLVLQVAGSALGSVLGGPFGAVLGQAIGGVVGAQIDQSLLADGGTKRVEGPRLREVDGLASTEGAAIPRVYGRARVGGQLIWATRFEEQVNVSRSRAKGGGKSMGGQKTLETTYSYFANLAIGLCEGPIAFVRRVWVDGRELDVTTVTMRLHVGSADQEPDPLIAAKEEGAAPAYRNTAYVVFERFPLANYGNRVPQFAFEVVRSVDGLPAMVRAVTLIPGAGEFVYETRSVSHEPEAGVSESLTRHQLYGPADVETALGHLTALCPNLRRIALVITWFGDDLRAGACSIAPRVEIPHKPTVGAEWQVAGLSRASARVVSQVDGRPAFGGTPTDASVIGLVKLMRDVIGLEVVLYPFVMMDIPAGNTLPDPATGAPGQPRYPWRGRITGSPESVDGTAEAANQVAAFLGTVVPADIALFGEEVVCAKPDEWSYRRLVLHCAALAQAAGGVHGFVLGSELVGLTRLQGPSGYPMVDGLVTLASDVREMLPEAKLTYAADWTEYGAHVRESGQEVAFPLDLLWASPDIDAIGIDFYPPLSDWRDTSAHADLSIAQGPSDLAYLRSRLNSGEAYDWYYAGEAGRISQERLPITDGAYGKPWIFRQKDLWNWWSSPHVSRSSGVETTATAFAPGTKPIWLTEVGVPAIDKGGNGPSFFPDPKSADSGLPYFSNGARDDLAQNRGLQAILSGFDPSQPGFEDSRNPMHPTTGRRMIDPGSIFIWSWDARPFPAFPEVTGAWADGANWQTGHWINGRIEGMPVDRLISAVLGDFGLPAADAIAVDGFVDGYVVDRPMSARQVLEPLAQAFGFDAIMSGGRLVFRGRGGRVARILGDDDWVRGREGSALSLRRAQESELPQEVRLSFGDSDNGYRRAAAASRRLAGAARRETAVETAIVTRLSEGQRLADQRLQEVWAGRETADFELSPRRVDLEPGDVVALPVDGSQRLFRLTRIGDGPTRQASARAVEPAIYATTGSAVAAMPLRMAPALPGRPLAVPMALPIARNAAPSLLALAVFASPWPGALALWQADNEGEFTLQQLIEAPSLVGETMTALPPGPLWRSDARAVLDVRLRGGILASVSDEAALAGANALALIGPDGEIEIVTAARVELIGDRQYRLSRLLRGLAGSEAATSRTLLTGARVVVLDGAAVSLTSDIGEIGVARRYRLGPARRDVGDPTMTEFAASAGAAALVPLSPVRPKARRTAAGLVIGWIRRTRLDGDSWDLAEVPIGEESERYAISVLAGGVPVVTVETAQPAWLYPAADEIADFGVAQTEIELAIVQLSSVIGPGREWRGRIAVR